MECEICGAARATKKIELDGSTLIACDECAKFGVDVTPKKPAQPPAQGAQAFHARKIMPPKEEEFDLGFDIVQDYGAQIRKAREQKGLTVQELARRMFEKESVLHKLEHQEMKPSDALIAKLGKELGIKLKAKKNDGAE